MTDSPASSIAPDTWAIVELMGHRVRAGRISEVEIAGSKFLRIDMATDDGSYVTEFYGGSAIYGIKPASEEYVRQRHGETALPSRPVTYRTAPVLPSPDADSGGSGTADVDGDVDEDPYASEGED